MTIQIENLLKNKTHLNNEKQFFFVCFEFSLPPPHVRFLLFSLSLEQKKNVHYVTVVE